MADINALSSAARTTEATTISKMRRRRLYSAWSVRNVDCDTTTAPVTVLPALTGTALFNVSERCPGVGLAAAPYFPSSAARTSGGGSVADAVSRSAKGSRPSIRRPASPSAPLTRTSHAPRRYSRRVRPLTWSDDSYRLALGPRLPQHAPRVGEHVRHRDRRLEYARRLRSPARRERRWHPPGATMSRPASAAATSRACSTIPRS